MPYRDEVPRVSIAQLRAQFTPRAFRALTRATLGVDGVVGEVALIDDAGQGFVRGARRWFVCPRCEHRANVLGAVDTLGWVCIACGGWRSRNRVRLGQGGRGGRSQDHTASDPDRATASVPEVPETRTPVVRAEALIRAHELLATLMESAVDAAGLTDERTASGGEVWFEDYDDYTDEESREVS